MATIAPSAFLTTFRAPVFLSSPRYNVKLGNSRLLQFNGSKIINKSSRRHSSLTNNRVKRTTVTAAKGDNPPIMPSVATPLGQVHLPTILLQNRTIFIGEFISPQVAQRAISQLLTLASIDEESDILIYLNCNGGSIYSTLAIYDCMTWIKPKVGTIAFGAVASQGAILLAGGEKGMRYAMPNSRVMIHQASTGFGGDTDTVHHQMNIGMQNRHRIDMMYSAFTGRSLEEVQKYTERDQFFTAGEALNFGLVDALLDTTY